MEDFWIGVPQIFDLKEWRELSDVYRSPGYSIEQAEADVYFIDFMWNILYTDADKYWNEAVTDSLEKSGVAVVNAVHKFCN